MKLWKYPKPQKIFFPSLHFKFQQVGQQKYPPLIGLIGNGKFYEDVFKEEGYNKVSEKVYYTKYHGYNYKIMLIEK